MLVKGVKGGQELVVNGIIHGGDGPTRNLAAEASSHADPYHTIHHLQLIRIASFHTTPILTCTA
jgi:hypothetical protein